MVINFPLRLFHCFLGHHIVDLVYANAASFQSEISRWQTSYTGTAKYYSCNYYYFGDSNIFGFNGQTASRKYTGLPSHTSLTFQVYLGLKGTWNSGHKVEFRFDGELVTFSSPINSLNSYFSYFSNGACGNTYYGVFDLVLWGHVDHSLSDLEIIIQSGAPLGTFGIRDFQMHFSNEPPPASPVSYWYSSRLASYGYKGTPCTSSNMWYNSTSGICQVCDPACWTCVGPGANMCGVCAAPRYFDGVNCTICHSSCFTCSGPGEDQCTSCTTPNYLLNNSCIACNSPLIQTSVSSAYGGSTLGNCISPCEPHEFVYPDGSCFDTCDSRFNVSLKSSAMLCVYPCTSGQLLYNQSTCIDSTACLYPSIIVKYGALDICEYDCPAGTVKFRPTNACIPILDCNVPYTINIVNDWPLCELACNQTTHNYTYWNNSCDNFCPTRMRQNIIDDVQICNRPLCGVVNCTQCASNGFIHTLCPDYYYCDEYLGNFCLPYYNYYLEAILARSVKNGHILQVEVLPSKNGLVPGINDTITLSVDGLTAGLHYSADIIPAGLGSFQINLLLLQTVEASSLYARIIYSPDNLHLETQILLPRVIYISAGVEDAVKDTQTSSQLLFLVFIITIVGMILSGGISALWAALPESQYSYYLLYLNIDYIHQTRGYLQSLGSYDFLSGSGSENVEPNLLLVQVGKRSLPSKFFSLGYPEDFLTNTDQVLIQVFIMVTGLAIASLTLRYIRFPRQLSFVSGLLAKVLRMLKWNGLLRQALTYTLPVSTAAFIQIYSSIFGHAVKIFPLISAIVILTVLLLALGKMYTLIRNTPEDRHQRALYTKLYGTLWEDLNIKQKFSKYYYWMTAMRGLILAYVCVFLDLFPYIQISVLLIYQAVILAMFFKNHKGLRPVFVEPTLNRIMFIEEGLLLLMKALILIFLYYLNTATNANLILLGWLIVLPGALIQIIQIGYSFYRQLKNRKKIWKMIKMSTNFLHNKKIKRIRRTQRPTLLTSSPNKTEVFETEFPLKITTEH